MNTMKNNDADNNRVRLLSNAIDKWIHIKRDIGITLFFFALGTAWFEIPAIIEITAIIHAFIAFGLFFIIVATLVVLICKKIKNKYQRIIFSIFVNVAYVVIGGSYLYTVTRPNFIILIPGPDLYDGEIRGFALQYRGSKHLENVELKFFEENSFSPIDKSIPYFSSVDNATQSPAIIQWKPQRPWNETYKADFITSGFHEVQYLTVMSIGGVIQYATTVKVNDKIVFQCRDSEIPATDKTAIKVHGTNCDDLMDFPVTAANFINPKPSSIERPDASVMLLSIKQFSPTVGAQIAKREIKDFQNNELKIALEGLAGSKLHILYSKGEEPKSYASELARAFQNAHWFVVSVKPAPQNDDFMVDESVSTDGSALLAPSVKAILRGLDLAGIKHRTKPIVDHSVPSDFIVLWVGDASPEGVNPDDCNEPSYIPHEMHQPCEMVSQSPMYPFPPDMQKEKGMDTFKIHGAPSNGTENKRK